MSTWENIGSKIKVLCQFKNLRNGKFPHDGFISKFSSSIWEWPNPVVWKNREGEIKISPGVTKGTFYFPQEWLSRIGEEKFPQERRSRDWGNENFPRSGEAATGEIFLHHDC